MKNTLIASFLLLIAAPTVSQAAIILNELDYDNVGTDTAEFVEIYNDGAAAVNIGGYVLAFINGNNNQFYSPLTTIPANTMLQAGSYYVIGNVVGSNQTFPGAQDQFQNGSPDAVGLYSGGTIAVGNVSTTNIGNLVMGVLYEGPADATNYPGFLAPGVATADSNSLNYSIGFDSMGSYNLLSAPTPAAVNAAAVPEPTVPLLGSLAFFGLLSRRRFSKN